jgi:hypothetical protein
MTSAKQVLAIQENAQKSDGPKSEEGKQKSALAAWRHPVTGHTVVMPQEDLKAYLAFRKGLEAQLQPANFIESQLVGRMIDLQWRLNRCFALEMAVNAIGHGETAGAINCSDSQVHAVMTAARVLRENNETLQVLGTHEQRLTRMYSSAKAELARVRAARKKEIREWTDAAAIPKDQQPV